MHKQLVYIHMSRGVAWGARGAQFPARQKVLISVTSAFFNMVHLLPKDLRFKHWCAKLLLVPGAI